MMKYTKEYKKQILALQDEYFITLNGNPVLAIEGDDHVFLIDNETFETKQIKYETFEKQTLTNNGKICVE